jgi:hypothetical protein
VLPAGKITAHGALRCAQNDPFCAPSRRHPAIPETARNGGSRVAYGNVP